MLNPKPMSMEEKEAFFRHSILTLYDLVDDVVNSMGLEGITNRSAQLEAAAPMIEQANRSIDTIAGIYTEIMKSNEPITDTRRRMMEDAFHDFFAALKTFTDDVETKLLH
jgi:hypothetical protein